MNEILRKCDQGGVGGGGGRTQHICPSCSWPICPPWAKCSPQAVFAGHKGSMCLCTAPHGIGRGCYGSWEQLPAPGASFTVGLLALYFFFSLHLLTPCRSVPSHSYSSFRNHHVANSTLLFWITVCKIQLLLIKGMVWCGQRLRGACAQVSCNPPPPVLTTFQSIDFQGWNFSCLVFA